MFKTVKKYSKKLVRKIKTYFYLNRPCEVCESTLLYSDKRCWECGYDNDYNTTDINRILKLTYQMRMLLDKDPNDKIAATLDKFRNNLWKELSMADRIVIRTKEDIRAGIKRFAGYDRWIENGSHIPPEISAKDRM